MDTILRPSWNWRRRLGIWEETCFQRHSRSSLAAPSKARQGAKWSSFLSRSVSVHCSGVHLLLFPLVSNLIRSFLIPKFLKFENPNSSFLSFDWHKTIYGMLRVMCGRLRVLHFGKIQSSIEVCFVIWVFFFFLSHRVYFFVLILFVLFREQIFIWQIFGFPARFQVWLFQGVYVFCRYC